ncbi:unnamed protein product [Phytophthora fragariaefolia]|uniref:Unnamed protein product n=1 Tax=Phytophthora fragariaefolia TaxID=1490495 RepID=A0A9W7D5C7_9STRA|nr:unnamed protein product [Phytophthora fragariaefolia]
MAAETTQPIKRKNNCNIQSVRSCFKIESGCYVFEEVAGSGANITVAVTTQRVKYKCKIGDPDERCYASGVNFASLGFPLPCKDVFRSDAGNKVCKTRLCQPSTDTIFNMEPYWVYLEFFFGILFTIEYALRVYAYPARRQLFGKISAVVDIVVLIPLYVEIVELSIGEMPTYSIVSTIPCRSNSQTRHPYPWCSRTHDNS